MKKIILKPWLQSLRLSVTIPAGFLVHIGARLAHEPTNWLLVMEIFFIASLAMVHNDYYDRKNDTKKGRFFAYEHPEQFKKFIIIGWSVVWVLALTFLLKYWMTLMPVILISMFYSYTRKLMYIQTLCVALTSASPLLIGHLELAKDDHGGNIIFFCIVFASIYAREMVKNIEDYITDKDWKYTPVSTGRTPTHEYLDAAGGIMYICTFVLGHILYKFSSQLPIITCIFLFIGTILCAGVAVWQNPGFMPAVPRYVERSEAEVEDDVKLGKKFFDYAMFSIIIGLGFV